MGDLKEFNAKNTKENETYETSKTRSDSARVIRKLFPGWKSIARRLGSSIGLVILLSVYIIGGTYYYI